MPKRTDFKAQCQQIALHITDSNVYTNNIQLELYLVSNLLFWIGHDSVMAATSSVGKRNMYPFYNPPLSLVVHVLHRVNHRKLVENNRANILRGFKFRTVKQLLASQPDPVAVDKEPKRAAATVPSDSSSIGKEHKRSGNIRNWLNYGKRCGRWSKACDNSQLWQIQVQQLKSLSRREQFRLRQWVVVVIVILCMCILSHTSDRLLMLQSGMYNNDHHIKQHK